MFYVNTRRREPVKEKDLLSAMLVPPEERFSKDHQVAYRFFADHEMLKELERTKSLNARIKCIAALLIIAREDYASSQHILMHIFEDQRIIVLPKAAKVEAETFNEKLIRRKMDLLSTFSMMQTLKYDELLYLAYNLEEQSCKYKDYLYREGEEPNHFFLIVEGEFHYVKDCNENEVKIKAKKNKKTLKLKSLEGEEESPNKFVKPHIIRYKVGIVQGKLGQGVGLEELVLEDQKEARKYSILCNSTQNKYLKIHKKYLETLFQEFPHFHQQIIAQIQDANRVKVDLFHKIKATKLNLNQYLKKSLTKEDHYEREDEQEMRSLEYLKDEEANRYKLPIIPKKSSFSNDYRAREKSRAFSSALSVSLKSQENRIKSMNSQSNLDSETIQQNRYDDSGAFALTSLKDQSNRKSLKSLKSGEKDPLSQMTEIRESVETKSFDPDIFLPLIGKRTVADLDGSSINLRPLNIKARSRMHQYGGMVDSSKLVQEKESILERKSTKIMREEIFPLDHNEYKQPKRIPIEDPMKLKASPAHSNRFMEKMLLKVLKRAGYDETGKQVPHEQVINNATVHVRPVIHTDFHRSLSKHKKKEQTREVRTVNKEQLLVNSAFDDCYFAKI